ncbi:conserved hypothetical protein [metagenome]|uniref:Uncharacterized protein n=1 Tax=metagenome TaxID=256318 RepID=A0A2P2C6H8_9ZZZZ
MFDYGSHQSAVGTPGAGEPMIAVDLRCVAARVASLDPAVDDAGRIEQLRALEEVKSAICAAQVRIAVEFAASQEAEQQASGTPRARVGAGIGAQIALARRESPHRGGRLLGLAKALVHEMPHTLAALESGLLNEWRATLIVRETACVSRHDRQSIDAQLWAHPDQVTTLGDRALAAHTRALAYLADPHAAVARASRAETERCVTLRPAPDTMTYLTALLPVAQGVAAYAALTHHADTTRATGDPRGRGQIMADTLVERLTGQTEASAVPVTVNLVMPDTALLAPVDGDHPGGEVADVVGHGPIPAGHARRLVAHAATREEAWVRRLYTHRGRLVALESSARCFPSGIADFIDLRDRRCRTPWCDAPIRHHDHIQAHTDGGPSSAINSQGLCEACNYTKQTVGWRARPGPDGTVTTVTPTGNTYRSPEPAPGLPDEAA